jgi:hypothetical protein
MENSNLIPAHDRVFAELQIDDTPQQAIHIGWEYLSDIYYKLLSGILGRNIYADAERDEYYYWLVVMCDTPITQDELESIFLLAGADELDRDQNDFGIYPITELCQGLCGKLMNKLLPYSIDYARADEDGVWFIGAGAITASESATPDMNGENSKRCLEKPLPDGTILVAEPWDEPDYPGIRISLRTPGGADEFLCFSEFNSHKPEGRQLYVCAYARDTDEPVYYESYNDSGSPSPNN